MGVTRWLLALPAFLATLPAALAHCPLCTAATGAAVGVARFYGVDDALMGVLIGGFVVSSALWAHRACKRRGWQFVYGQATIFVLASLILTIIGFKTGNLLTGTTMFGLPRLLSGMLLGTGAVSVGHIIHEYLRQSNHNKNYIPLQGMSIALGALLIPCAAIAGGFL